MKKFIAIFGIVFAAIFCNVIYTNNATAETQPEATVFSVEEAVENYAEEALVHDDVHDVKIIDTWNAREDSADNANVDMVSFTFRDSNGKLYGAWASLDALVQYK